MSADAGGSDAFISVTSFLTPSTLWRIPTESRQATAVKSLAPQFDASAEIVEQDEAASKDGTRIPYFVVRPAHLKYAGTNPALLYAYGGFAISLTSAYSGTLADCG